MPIDLLIRNGQIVTPDGVRGADVAIDGGTIVEIAPGLSTPADQTIDATGLHLFPGVIDPHVHFNEPGRADWEGFATGSSALAAGGGTCFFDMPLNSTPPVLDGPSFDAKVAAGSGKSYADFALWGGLTPANLDKLDELADRGVIGFKAFMSDSGIDEFATADDYTLYRGMQIAAERGLVVAVHAENDAITSGLTAEARRHGRKSIDDYAASRPVVAEVEAITRAVQIARAVRCKLHIVHVSTADGARAARSAADADVTFETCPHYFLLDQRDLLKLGATAKCAPPLRSECDMNYLRQALRDDAITFVASDHSPAPASMKSGDDFFAIWGGISGVQLTLPALLTIEPPVDATSVARCTARAIAHRFNIARKGSIEVGHDGDVTLVDIAMTYTLTRDDLLDRHKLSPYVGRTFRGRVRRTILRGRTVFEDGKIVGKPRGQLLKPTR